MSKDNKQFIEKVYPTRYITNYNDGTNVYLAIAPSPNNNRTLIAIAIPENATEIIISSTIIGINPTTIIYMAFTDSLDDIYNQKWYNFTSQRVSISFFEIRQSLKQYKYKYLLINVRPILIDNNDISIKFNIDMGGIFANEWLQKALEEAEENEILL